MYQWDKLFKGAVRIEETPAGVIARRFTERQLAFYASVSEMSSIRAAGGAGIRMEFITDSPEISFSYETTAFCRDSLYFDFYENGVLCGVVKEPDNSPGGSVSYRKHSAGDTRITIYFPYTCGIVLKEVSLGNVQYIEEQTVHYLALGDSITQGMDAKHASFNYPAILSRYFGWDYLNQGVGGFYFDPASLDADLPFRPDIITVAYGVNDCYMISIGQKTLAEVERAVKSYMGRLRTLSPKTEIYVITPIWRTAEYEYADIASGLRNMRELIAGEASERGFRVIDGERLVPHDSGFFGDGALHPNEMGFLEYAMHMIPQMQSISQKGYCIPKSI